jgi:hypothetical protein
VAIPETSPTIRVAHIVKITNLTCDFDRIEHATDSELHDLPRRLARSLGRTRIPAIPYIIRTNRGIKKKRFDMAGTAKIEHCANCDRPIGKLETAFVFKEAVVCAECNARLTNAITPPPLPSRAAIVAYAAPTAMRPAATGLDHIICSNPACGYIGTAQRKAKGSLVVGILLFVLGVLPGLVYLVVYSGYVLVCPQCGMKIREEQR